MKHVAHDCTHDHATPRLMAVLRILPVLACAVCPVCLGNWALLLSAAGVTVALTEPQHLTVLLLATSIACITSVVRARSTRRWAAAWATFFGCSCILVADLLGENFGLTVLGVGSVVLASTGDWIAMRAAGAAKSHPDVEPLLNRE